MDLLKVRNKINMGLNLKDLNLRVTYYSRVSTDNFEQKKSLNNQKEYFERMIKENANWQYIDGYIDDGITGTSDIKRNNFMRMINDAKNGEFDLIITKEISRFSRNTLDSIKYTRLLLTYGVAVLFLNDNINTIMPDSELRLTIMASLAQDEIRRLSERVKFGMHRSQQRGEILGNNMLFGYIKDKNGNLKIVKDEAKIVKDIYNMYIFEDLSLSKISKILNARNIKTKQNKSFSTTSISRIIKNPKYKGFYCGKKVEVVDYMTKRIKYLDEKDWIIYKDNKKIPPIVSEKIWNLANEKINNKKKRLTKNIDNNIYNNKMYCSIHDKPFYKRYFRKNKKDITWICSEYLNKGKEYCNSPNIRQSEIDEIIKDIICKIKLDKEIIINDLISIYMKDNVNFPKKELIKRKEDLKLKIDKLIDLNINNIITKGELKNKIEYLKEEEKKIDLEIEKVDSCKYINNSSLRREINLIINSKVVKEKIKELLINKIIVSKNKDSIILNINLNINRIIKEKNYEFKRGFDTKSTKRYVVNYLVKCYYLEEGIR